MRRLRLTTTAKVFVSAVALSIVAAATYFSPRVNHAQGGHSAVPPQVVLPGEKSGAFPDVSGRVAGCTDRPEVRVYHWAWNSQMGMMVATGGPRATSGSLMCQRGVNLSLVREDNPDQMQAQLVTFAEAYKNGQDNPAQGAHFVAIMGDGSAQFLQGVNERLGKLGPDYRAVVIGSAGYSRGEDKFMGPPAWRLDPQKARGGVVAGVLRDGDWNIALKWLGDNKIPNNPNDKTYDPDALNWVAASDYVDAAQKYVSGYCTDLTNVKTGKREKRCVDAVVTWTPGDVTVAEGRGGLVSIVSTKEYRSQMPNVIIGNAKWMRDHRTLTTNMLSAVFDGGERVKHDDHALREAAAVSAVVYKEKDAAYWYKYFHVQKEADKQGLEVELGGSSVNNLADNAQLFGLAPGSVNAFGTTYTVFGNVVRSQYPELVPTLDPAEKVTDTSYIKDLLAAGPAGTAETATFDGQGVKQVVSRRAWNIEFQSGSASFSRETQKELDALLADLVVASGTAVEIHGHTDAAGNADANMRLSEDRAFAVKRWLEGRAPASFPQGRIKVVAHGQTEPLASNATAEGRAKNRRVVVVMGTTAASM